ncbi:hypothetical protein ACHAQE_004815 [Botrytis cinerea]
MLLFVKTCNVVANRSAVNLVYLEKKEPPASQKEQSAVRVGVASGIVVVDTSVTLTVSGNPHANSERVSATTELAWAKPKSETRPWESAVQYLNGAKNYVFFAVAMWYGQHGLDFSSGKMARAMFKDNLSQHHKERISSSHFKRSIIELDWLKSEQIIENAVMSIN